MRVCKLVFSNYRCFDQFELEFSQDFTVLVGKNGSGKSTVLDGLATGLSSFFLGMPGSTSGSISQSDVRTVSYAIGSRMERQAQYPARIVCQGILNGEGLSWARARNTDEGRTTYGEADQLAKTAKTLYQRIQTGDISVKLPILAYYGTGRLWAKKKERKETVKVPQNSRVAGYADCLDAISHEKRMDQWFEQMTYLELQENRPIPELEAVRRAILTCFNQSGNAMLHATRCIFNVKTHEIEVTYETKEHHTEVHAISEMSDGYRNMLSMVADIAYRMALLNPQLLENVTEETEGIILIDEIDLHLHPSWQRQIVRTLKTVFPKVQFIVTTHAPSVIASVKQEEVVMLDGHAAIPVPCPTYGKDSNAILETVMDVPERQDDVKHDIESFHKALAEGRFEQAQIILNQLRALLGDNDPEVIGAQTAYTLETMD